MERFIDQTKRFYFKIIWYKMYAKILFLFILVYLFDLTNEVEQDLLLSCDAHKPKQTKMELLFRVEYAS